MTPPVCWWPSPNHGARRGPIDMVLLHYTGMATTESACRWLCSPESKVSAHYLVDEAGAVTQMVHEIRRAWHAGVSTWAGESDINSRSIGIEIHNLGPDSDAPEYPAAQIDAVIDLVRAIVARRRIPRHRILAHSDVAPGRKFDPGPYFPWATLAGAGLGLWIDPPPPGGDNGLGPGDTGNQISKLQQKLAAFGYGLEATGDYDERTVSVVKSFQLHFRPKKTDGRADVSTRGALDAILETCG